MWIVTREVIGQGKFLRLVREGRYEFAERTRANGVVIIVPITAAREVLFIEQVRPPVGTACIEFPAGLSGDHEDSCDENLVTAALRELVEETGYEAEQMELIGRSAPTAGLTSEIHTYFLATGLRRVTRGGGVEGEQIVSHLVPQQEVSEWLETQSRTKLVASMVYSGLYLSRGA